MSYKLRLAVNRDRESLAIRMPGALRLAATLHSGEIVRLLRLYDFGWSGRPDLNRRPHAPQACALPGCATPRPSVSATTLRPTPRAIESKITGRITILYGHSLQRFH